MYTFVYALSERMACSMVGFSLYGNAIYRGGRIVCGLLSLKLDSMY